MVGEATRGNGWVENNSTGNGFPCLLLDLVYLLALAPAVAVAGVAAVATGRYRADLAAKLLGRVAFPTRSASRSRGSTPSASAR